jgi:hypothetical protein
LFIAEELGDDESLVLFVAAVLTLIVTFRWLLRLSRTTTLGRPAAAVWRVPLCLCPLASLFVVLLPVLCAWADPQVRNDGRYVALFMFVGVIVLSGATLSLSVLGIQPALDAIESSNPAAVIAVCAAQAAATLVYAGANIGVGDTIWTTLGPAGLGLVSLFIVWLIVEGATGTSESIALDRDAASAVRFSGFIVACGAILGRGLAGNYVSVDATVHDLAGRAWPVLVLMGMAIAAHARFRPTPQSPRPPVVNHGVLPAVFFLIAAGVWILYLGRW